ncbi:MAG: heparinase II/III family protein [Paludibacter sp.]|nr:heparinase II/III family protein [Paludibacter sp.]
MRIISVFIENTIILFMIMLFSCGNVISPIDDKQNLSPDNDGLPDPTGSYDYSTISDHPRLLFSKEDEVRLKQKLSTNSDLSAINDVIISSSNAILNTTPVTRVLSGKRLLAVSRTALKRIFYLSYSYRMTNDKRYLNRAERELNAVCDFTDWNPSHFLDVGEMSMGVAIGYDWLYDSLNVTTRYKIREALKNKAFTPSKNSSYNWFLTNDANWNQVCNTGLTYGALAIYEGAKDLSVEIIERCLNSIKLPLDAYGPDGNYQEGYMYWAYGTSFQVMLLAALDSALGSDKDLYKTPGFLKTAEYILYMVGSDQQCYNYSDSYKQQTPCFPMFWFSKKSNNSSLIYTEKKMIAGGGAYIQAFDEDRLLPAAIIFANNCDLSNTEEPTKKIWVGQGETPVALVRTGWDVNDTYLGVKGGKAGNSHGHMDAGSFVYVSDGVRWAMDLGMQDYLPLETKGIDLWNMGQDSQRWEVFRLNNKAHNTLTINDKRHLVNGMARITKTYDSDAMRGVEIDMTEVFQDDLSEAKRTVALIDNKKPFPDSLKNYSDLIKNNFVEELTIGNDLEEGYYQYTDQALSPIQVNQWNRAARTGNTGGVSPKITSPLSYDGYIDSNVGNSFELSKLSNSESRLTTYSLTNSAVYRQGSYYLSFLINVGSNTIAGDNVAVIMFDGTYTGDFQRICLCVKNETTNNTFKFGLAAKDGSTQYPAIYAPSIYNYGTTYLVVMKYDFTNGKANLYVNPTLQSEPSPLASITNSDLNDKGIRGITVRQRTNYSAKIGSLRFVKSWSNIFCGDYLLIKDSLRTTYSNKKVEWRMVTIDSVEQLGTNSFKLMKDGKIMLLNIESKTPFTIKTWSTQPTTDYDAPNPGTIIVGFESILIPNQSNSYKVRLFKSHSSLPMGINSSEVTITNYNQLIHNKEIVSEEYFSLTGIRIYFPIYNSILIKKTVYADGFMEIKKILNKSNN